MNFLKLCNLILESLLIENVKQLDLHKIYSEINYSEELYRKKDKQKFKNELKEIKKRLISKLIQTNYNSMMDNYFPSLKKDSKMSSDQFHNKLFNTPEIWENFKPEDFSKFIEDIEKAIDFLSSIHNSRYSNLKLISKKYINR
jgi:transcription initiation factor IIE alpha subunit